ncbi:MAG: hypothetical protein IJ573_07735 [Clostridia bacterium]|nr:hypothetical protein [Clostridia bacterium]
MKKALVLFSMILLSLLCLSASAEGKLKVTSKNTIIYTGKDSGVFLAKVENTGDAPVYYDNGKLVIFSEDDEILDTEDYISSSPSDLLLNPGEYTYVYEFLWSSSLKNAKLGDIKFSVSSDNRGYSYKQIPSTAVIDMQQNNSYSNYVDVTFTNTGDEVLYGAYVVCAMLDNEDNVIFVNRNSYDNLGVHPGSTVTIKMYIDSDLIDYYGATGIKPAKVDSLVYTERTK